MLQEGQFLTYVVDLENKSLAFIYTPTILGELYNDGAYSKQYRGRFEGNAKLIESWHNGQSTMFDLPKGVNEEDLETIKID